MLANLRQIILFSEEATTLFELEEFILSKKLAERIFTFSDFNMMHTFICSYPAEENIILFEKNNSLKYSDKSLMKQLKEIMCIKNLKLILLSGEYFTEIDKLLHKNNIHPIGYIQSLEDKYSIENTFNIINMKSL